MWPLLVACSQPPSPDQVAETRVALTERWSNLELPMDGARVLIARTDSLVVEGPSSSLSIDDWHTAIEAAGWVQTKANDGRGGLLAHTFSNPAEPTATLLFGVTEHNDVSTHSLLWTTQ